MPAGVEIAAGCVRAMVEARWTRCSLEEQLEHTPRWRFKRRAELSRVLATSRSREQQALHLLDGAGGSSYQNRPAA